MTKIIKIDSYILTINQSICKNIEKFGNTDRGILSQNILDKLRNFIEHIALKFYCNGQDIEDTYENIQKAINFVKTRGKLKLLSRFHNLLQITVSHYTLDEESSERLMLKYYEYLIKIKSLLNSEFSLDVLENLQNFPVKTDSASDEYYKKIAEKIELPVYSRKKTTYNDRCYIQKIKPFFIGLEIYYEVTFTRANDYISKFDRIIAFTKLDISHNYSVKFSINNDSIHILDKNMPIHIIDSWEVSIRPCEINNFARIFGQYKPIGGNRDSRELMNYLTATGLNLVELIDFPDKEFANVKMQLSQHSQVTHFIDILEECRQLTKQSQQGCNVIRYMLYRLNNRIIKKQYNNESCSRLSNLYLKWGCIPFDDMPFDSSLISHNPKVSDLFNCIDSKDRQHELLGRFIRNNTEQEGQLYTNVQEIEKFNNIDELIKTFNDSLYYKHKNRSLETYKNHIYIKEYEANTYHIIKELKEWSSKYINNYTNSTDSWLQSTTHVIDCIEKKNALREMFESSKVALIYGAAGTGKSTMINHISHRFNEYNKNYLAHTNPAVDNLKRRIDANNCTFQTIARFLRSNQTSSDLLFIDECSTVSNSDMVKILQTASFKLLILVGDIFQIESIRFGNWFSLANQFIPDSAIFELTTPYRTTNNKLLTLWDRVRKYEDNILECLTKNNYSVTLDESIFEPAKNDEIVLCLNYDGLYGINNINRFLQSSNTNPAFEWGTNIYKVNDPILFNETDRFAPLIYNNLKGKIAGIEILEDRIQFDIEIDKVINDLDAEIYDFQLMQNTQGNNSVIRFSVNEYKSTDQDDVSSDTIIPFQIAYAVSIHKAQGLEYSSVKIVISDEVEEMISHNIFYTAITRARERLKIYWTPETENKILDSFKQKNIGRDKHLLKSKYNL